MAYDTTKSNIAPLPKLQIVCHRFFSDRDRQQLKRLLTATYA